MAKNYDIKTTTARDADLVDDMIYLGSLSLVDTADYNEVTEVTDKDTGETYSFSSKSDAMDFISKSK